MILSQVFERFVEASPISVMVRGLLETILSPQKLDELFEKSSKTQYTKELLFSTVVEMMNTVACGIRPSIHAAYQAKASKMDVSVTSVYNKLNAMESTVEADDVWIADRNFCTLNFLAGIAAKQAYFIIREHKCLPWHSTDKFHSLGSIEGGQVFEQSVTVSDEEGHLSQLRRIKVVLEETTRDGDSEIFILTTLSSTVATGLTIAQLYRHRWSIETLFQVLTDIFNCEIKTLGYPKAALFAFCVALVSYNVLSVVLAALRSVHGIEKIEQEVSSYYLADEIRGTYRGMMIAIAPPEWQVFNQINLINLTQILKHLATKVNLAVFLSHPRSTKKTKKWVKKTRPTKKPHVSTAKILSQN